MIYRLLIVFGLCSVLVSCAEKQSILNLSGEWEAIGYFCYDGPIPSEIISIEQENNQLVAVKVIGDNCILSGDTTWIATIEGSDITGEIFGLSQNGGKVEVPCKLFVVDDKLYLRVQDSYGSYTITMSRFD